MAVGATDVAVPLRRTLFDTGAEHAELARKLFPNQGVHNEAAAIAFCHPRGIQYLEQAPVIVLGGGAALRVDHKSEAARRMRAAFLREKLRPLFEAGAPLKEVMRALGLAPPLRTLSPHGIVPNARETVAALSRLDPAVLGRIVPAKPGAQKRWLSACHAWRERMVMRRQPADTHFAWAAEAMALQAADRSEARDMADFASWRENGFSTAWKWKRACEERDRWHARLTVEAALRRSPVTPETVIDLGKHPDVLEHAGLTFVALRTPLALADEGAVMRHCVATYVQTVFDGHSHIVGVRRGETRLATLEMGKGLSLKQLKAKANGEPPHEVRMAAVAYLHEVRRLRDEAVRAAL